VAILCETDSRSATLQRKTAYADAAKQGHLVAAAHIAFPWLGQLRANGKGRAWLPVNETALT